MGKLVNILIVEDKSFWIETIRNIISEIGTFQVKTVKNEKDAFKVIDTNEIDIAIIDLNLSDSIQKEEYEGINLIKHLMGQGHMPVLIVVTGYIHFDTDVFEQKYGVRKLFLKSTFEKTEFKKLIEETIQKGSEDGNDD
jgi:DNA-binding NtrC family response regulator